jgi:hypothetical protein
MVIAKTTKQRISGCIQSLNDSLDISRYQNFLVDRRQDLVNPGAGSAKSQMAKHTMGN